MTMPDIGRYLGVIYLYLLPIVVIVNPTKSLAQGNEVGSITGAVIDTLSWKPIAGIRVLCEKGFEYPPFRSTITDSTGQYLFEDIPTGYYWIHTSGYGYSDALTDSVLVRPGEATVCYLYCQELFKRSFIWDTDSQLNPLILPGYAGKTVTYVGFAIDSLGRQTSLPTDGITFIRPVRLCPDECRSFEPLPTEKLISDPWLVRTFFGKQEVWFETEEGLQAANDSTLSLTHFLLPRHVEEGMTWDEGYGHMRWTVTAVYDSTLADSTYKIVEVEYSEVYFARVRKYTWVEGFGLLEYRTRPLRTWWNEYWWRWTESYDWDSPAKWWVYRIEEPPWLIDQFWLNQPPPH